MISFGREEASAEMEKVETETRSCYDLDRLYFVCKHDFTVPPQSKLRVRL
jgi:hypothetical protein